MLQPPFDHLVAQPIGLLANCRAGHKMMLVLSVCIDLLPNVFVKKRKPFVRHVFDTHNQTPT
jgi:hypothetical protein